MKAFALAAILQLTAVAAANLCNSDYDSYQQICGEAVGDFQLLGSLCFAGGTDGVAEKASITFSLTFADVGTVLSASYLNHYEVLFYDDQYDSFAAVNRITDDGNYQNCTEREACSKGICNGDNDCTYGWKVVTTKDKTVDGSLTTYRKTITIEERYAREWYFVLNACGISTAIKLHSYNMTSDSAVNCDEIYEKSDAGYIAAIVVLSLAMVVLAVISFIFYKRTKIPELLSMVRGHLLDISISDVRGFTWCFVSSAAVLFRMTPVTMNCKYQYLWCCLQWLHALPSGCCCYKKLRTIWLIELITLIGPSLLSWTIQLSVGGDYLILILIWDLRNGKQTQ